MENNIIDNIKNINQTRLNLKNKIENTDLGILSDLYLLNNYITKKYKRNIFKKNICIKLNEIINIRDIFHNMLNDLIYKITEYNLFDWEKLYFDIHNDFIECNKIICSIVNSIKEKYKILLQVKEITAISKNYKIIKIISVKKIIDKPIKINLCQDF
jgi:hypothetical protein